MCPMNDVIENTEHFLLLCPAFEIQRRNLLAGIRPFVQINFSTICPSLLNNILVETLLYGHKDFSDDVNKTILELTIKFINETGRFD